MKLDKFDGGLSTRVDPSLIQPNEAVLINNVDTTSLRLVSAKDYLNANKEVRGYFYNFKDNWVSSYLERSYVEYNNKLYYSELLSPPKKWDGMTEKLLGIIGPTTKLVATEQQATATFEKTTSLISHSVNVQSLYFTPNGYTLYILDVSNDAIDQYELSIAWDIETISYSKTISIAAKEPNATGMTFKADGTRLYIIGNNNAVYQYNLSTAWDISTAVYSTTVSTTTQTDTPQSLALSDDGLKLFVLCDTTDKVYAYTLSTAWAVNTATYANIALDMIELTAKGIHFNLAGTRLYVVGTTGDKVLEYTLSTAWDISTAVYYGELSSILTETSDATDIFFSQDMSQMYVTGETTAAEIDQYKVNRISSADSTIQYVYTYYNSIDDVESVPSEVSDELELKAIRGTKITGFVLSDDPQVDKIRIYRIGDNVTEFELVEEIDISIADYYDRVATTDLTTIMDSASNYVPKDGAKYLTEAYGMFFYALDNKLYFNLTGKPDAWPEEFYINFNQNITGILPISDGVLVFGASRTDILLGTSPSEFTKRNISLEQGCTSHYSAKFVKNRPIWLSNEGFCTISSGGIEVISKDKLGTRTFDIINAAAYDETYWVCLIDGSLLAIDARFNLAFKTYELTKPLNNIYAKGTLYGVVDTDRLATLFKGASLPFEYLSPILIEDSYAEVKLYNNIYVKYNGSFVLFIYIDGIEVAQYTLVGNDYKELNVPEDKQRGNSIQFKVTGIGTFHEIEYKVQGRQNGR